MPLFFFYVALVYCCINFWIIGWFWRALRGSGRVRVITCLVLLFIAACFPFGYLSSSASLWAMTLLRIGVIWIGVFIYVFLMVLVADGVVIIRRLFRVSSQNYFQNSSQKHRQRPRYLACMAVVVLTVMLGVAGWINAAYPVVREFDVTVPTQQSELQGKTLTIAALSDLHLGRTLPAARLSRAMSLIAPHQPDAVFFLGDVLDDHILLDLDAMRDAIALVQPPLGVWGILGNHEYISGQASESQKILEQVGIRILRDNWAALENQLLLVGRDDYSKPRFTHTERAPLAEVLEAVPSEFKQLPLIVLDHQPQHLDEAERAGAALQLSGHTHNGQIWPANLIVSRVFENPYGYSTRSGTHYLVSAGAGTWGPPMRNTARPDVLIVRLRFN